MRDFKSALADFDAALKLNPKYADALNNRAITKKKMGDLAGAIADYTEALKCDPSLYRVYLNRGIAHSEAGDVAAAMQDLSTAVDHKVPQAAEPLRQLRQYGKVY